MLNHNIETVARLQRAVRPSAGYARSLGVLARAGAAGLVTKSGLMVGLGEREDEVVATMADLRGVGVSIVTVGQYLRPSRDHLPVARYWTPEEFERLRAGRRGARPGPRRGVAAHPVELPRPGGGVRRRHAVSQAGSCRRPLRLRHRRLVVDRGQGLTPDASSLQPSSWLTGDTHGAHRSRRACLGDGAGRGDYLLPGEAQFRPAGRGGGRRNRSSPSGSGSRRTSRVLRNDGGQPASSEEPRRAVVRQAR